MSELKCCKLCASFKTCDRKNDCCPECKYFDVVDVVCLAPEVLKKKKKTEPTIVSEDDEFSSDVDPETFLFEDDDEDFEEDEFDLIEDADDYLFEDDDW